MYHRLFCIINPASGPDFPVLAFLNRVIKKYELEVELRITLHAKDAIKFAKEALQAQPEAVVVYGGDGTVMEVAQVLCHQPLPLIIIPGGTANVMAKELGLSTDLNLAFEILGKDNPTPVKVDMAQCNQTPFMLRLNTGILAEMITDTSREQKDRLGNIAYGVSAVQHLDQLTLQQYQIEIGNQTETVEGVALMLANAGNIGVAGISLLPEIKVTDGFLDLVVLQSADIASLIALATSTVTSLAPPTSLYHRQVTHLKISLPPAQSALLDDRKIEETHFDISILPEALTIVT